MIYELYLKNKNYSDFCTHIGTTTRLIEAEDLRSELLSKYDSDYFIDIEELFDKPERRHKVKKKFSNKGVEMSGIAFNSKGIIVSINVPGVSASYLHEAINQLNLAMVCVAESTNSMTKVINDLSIKYENTYPILKDKQHEKYGWYRKFEKKRF